jgi:hypothetical protein
MTVKNCTEHNRYSIEIQMKHSEEQTHRIFHHLCSSDNKEHKMILVNIWSTQYHWYQMWWTVWNGSAPVCELYSNTTLQFIVDAARDIYETNKEEFILKIYPLELQLLFLEQETWSTEQCKWFKSASSPAVASIGSEFLIPVCTWKQMLNHLHRPLTFIFYTF